MGRPFSAVELARMRTTEDKIPDSSLEVSYAPASNLVGLNAQIASLAAADAALRAKDEELDAGKATAAQGAKADTALQPLDPPLGENIVEFAGTLNGAGTTVTLRFDSDGRLAEATSV